MPTGSGKTALALEFCFRHREDFDAVLWLTCGRRTVAAFAGDLAAQLGVRLDRDLESNLQQIRQVCARHRCLLVLDDVVDPTAAAGLAPRGRTSVLITTRNSELAAALSASHLPLAGWPPSSECKLNPDALRLLSAMCACAPSGFRLEIAAARLASPTGRLAMEQLHLLSQGMLIELVGMARVILSPQQRDCVRGPLELAAPACQG